MCFVYVCCIVSLQPNGAEEIYGMDQLSKFEEEKMKEVCKKVYNWFIIEGVSAVGDARIDEEHH